MRQARKTNGKPDCFISLGSPSRKNANCRISVDDRSVCCAHTRSNPYEAAISVLPTLYLRFVNVQKKEGRVACRTRKTGSEHAVTRYPPHVLFCAPLLSTSTNSGAPNVIITRKNGKQNVRRTTRSFYNVRVFYRRQVNMYKCVCVCVCVYLAVSNKRFITIRRRPLVSSFQRIRCFDTENL